MTRLAILFAAAVLSLAAFAIGWDNGRCAENATRTRRERERLQPSRN